MRRYQIGILIMILLSFSQAARLVPPLQEEDFSQGPVNVIVTLKKPDFGVAVTGEQRAEVSQLIRQVLSDLNSAEFQAVYQYQTIPCFSGRLTQSGLTKLAQNPQVEYIEQDQRAFAFLAESVPLIRADSVHSLGYTGEGCVVGVLDTGIDSLHADLTDDLIAQHHFLNSGADTGYGAYDGHGHGTWVSGIISSGGTISSVGVAPDAKIVAVKVLNDSGSGFFSDIVSGLDWVAANNDSLSVDVINMSLGGGLFSTACDGSFPSLKAAVDACRAVGIAVFAASGNDGNKFKISAPGCINGVFSVGAVYDEELGREPDTGNYTSAPCFDAYTSPYKVACFSNRNANLKILGPGSWIVGPYPGNTTTGGWGTSFATPHCAGVATLICEKDSTLAPDSVLRLMQNTGRLVYDTATGLYFKRVDALGAVLGCIAIPGDANASGSLNLTDIISQVNFVFNKPNWPACYVNTTLCWLSELFCRGDWNGDNGVNLSDVIRGVNFVFNKSGGPWNPLPSAACCQSIP